MHTIRSGYRFGCWPWFSHWISPRTYTNWIKFYYQRATRGWADCDTWSLDNYLSEWLPNALTHFKKHQHGFPCEMCADTNKDEHTKEEETAAIEKWDKTLDEIIDGFKAYNRITDGLYEEELGEYPVSDDIERYKKTRKLEERDQKLFEEGMVLFVKHFQSLWD